MPARTVKQTVAIGQHWQENATGTLWEVLNPLYRGTGPVLLREPSGGRRSVSFQVLGERYELVEEER